MRFFSRWFRRSEPAPVDLDPVPPELDPGPDRTELLEGMFAAPGRIGTELYVADEPMGKFLVHFAICYLNEAGVAVPEIGAPSTSGWRTACKGHGVVFVAFDLGEDPTPRADAKAQFLQESCRDVRLPPVGMEGLAAPQRILQRGVFWIRVAPGGVERDRLVAWYVAVPLAF